MSEIVANWLVEQLERSGFVIMKKPPMAARRRLAVRVQRLAQVDAEALDRDHGGDTYREARQRERNEVPKPQPSRD
jgi:hypothetical protein